MRWSWIRRPGRCLAWSSPDVTGKGLPAALMMAFSRAVMRSAAYNGRWPGGRPPTDERGPGPRRANWALPDRARRQARPDRWKAGDTPTPGTSTRLLLRRASRRVRKAPGALAPCLGSSINPRSLTVSVTLGAGRPVFVYPDGVTDATASDGRRFGLERLVDVIPRSVAKSRPSAVIGERSSPRSTARWRCGTGRRHDPASPPVPC